MINCGRISKTNIQPVLLFKAALSAEHGLVQDAGYSGLGQASRRAGSALHVGWRRIRWTISHNGGSDQVRRFGNFNRLGNFIHLHWILSLLFETELKMSFSNDWHISTDFLWIINPSTFWAVGGTGYERRFLVHSVQFCFKIALWICKIC